MDNQEVKSAVETLGKTFESFKEVNDKRLNEIEAKGKADPVTEDNKNKTCESCYCTNPKR